MINANIGTAITYIQDGTNGDRFLINEDGVYSVSYSEIVQTTTTFNFGVVRNPTSLSTSILSQPVNSIVCATTAPGTVNGANAFANCSATWPLNRGDILYCMGDGTANTGDANERFTITKVSL